MQTATHLIIPGLLDLLWQGAVIFAVTFALIRFGKIRSSTMCYFLWFITLVTLALLPFVSVSLRALASHPAAEPAVSDTDDQTDSGTHAPMYLAVKPDKQSAGKWYDASYHHLNMRSPQGHGQDLFDSSHFVSNLDEPAAKPEDNVSSPAVAKPSFLGISSRTWLTGLAAPWLSVVLILFARLAISCHMVGKLLARSRAIHDEEILAIISSLESDMGVKRNIRFCISDQASVPFSSGVFRPVVILPSGAIEDGGRADMRSILIHEITHVIRWDVPAKVLQYVITALLFFFPPVWLIAREMNRFREEICDEAVVRKTGDPMNYARCLVRISRDLKDRPLHGMVGMRLGEYKSRLRSRVEAIAGGTLRPAVRIGIRKSLAVLLGMMCLVPVISVPGMVLRKNSGPDPLTYQTANPPEWVPTDGPYGCHVDALALHPQEPLTLIVGSVGLFRSEDGGDTWQRPKITPSILGKGLVASIAFSRADPNRAYAVINQSLVVSDDGGKTWKERFSCPRWMISTKEYGEQLRGIMVTDPFDPDRISFLNPNIRFEDTRPKIIASEDGGRTFTNILLPMKSGDNGGVDSFSADENYPGVFHVRHSDGKDHRIAISNDYGRTWESWSLGDASRANFVDSCLDPNDPNTLYCLIHHSGAPGRSIVKLDLTTSRWQALIEPWDKAPEMWTVGREMPFGIKPVEGEEDHFLIWSGVHSSPADRSIAYYNTGYMIARTTDRGENWREVGHGLPYFFETQPTVHPSVPGAALVGSFLTEDYGETWRDIIPDEAWPLGTAVFHPHIPGRIMCRNYRPSVFYRSDDNGHTWSKLSDHWGWGIIFHPKKPGTYWILQTRRIYETVDDGATWSEISIPELADGSEYSRSAVKDDMALQVFPNGLARLFIVGEEPRVFKLEEEGNYDMKYSCVSNVDGRRRLAVLDNKSLHLSTDGGENWLAIPSAEIPPSITSMEFDVNKDILIIGTSEGRALGFDWSDGRSYMDLGNRAHVFRISGISPSPNGKAYWMSTRWGGVWVLRDEDGPSFIGREGFSNAWSKAANVPLRSAVSEYMKDFMKRTREHGPEVPELVGKWVD